MTSDTIKVNSTGYVLLFYNEDFQYNICGLLRSWLYVIFEKEKPRGRRATKSSQTKRFVLFGFY
jgi:hypothetical protein